ncbi:hypothetical protein F442_07707 [Phytophthora nicotianae P10297]|uniref:Uncharacterized protein n=1 Tax=Phytophthora nicotianae P10297 TaxID=1317064 RepID=W2ZFA1_PHYNI|nr:hypothetical protein F442_07707 [Phytophthora nicotianae P10297]
MPRAISSRHTAPPQMPLGSMRSCHVVTLASSRLCRSFLANSSLVNAEWPQTFAVRPYEVSATDLRSHRRGFVIPY